MRRNLAHYQKDLSGRQACQPNHRSAMSWLALGTLLLGISVPGIVSAQQLLWTRHYNFPGGNGEDMVTAQSVVTSRGIYVTGSSWGGSGTSDDFLTIKYNHQGVWQWTARYDGPAHGDD
ncbi:unnamed protein product, partial [marine sediment metagenome]